MLSLLHGRSDTKRASSSRITAEICAYHGRDTGVSWTRYGRITGVIRELNTHYCFTTKLFM